MSARSRQNQLQTKIQVIVFFPISEIANYHIKKARLKSRLFNYMNADFSQNKKAFNEALWGRSFED